MSEHNETLTDIVAKMRYSIIPKHRTDHELLALYADRIEAAHGREKATTEISSAVGDAAAMREALESILNLAYEVKDANADGGCRTSIPTEFVIDSIKHALAAPPRNCDMLLVVDGPADNDADKAWLIFKQHNPDAYFDAPGLLRCIDWLLAHATEGGAK